jgi:C-terminal processing protease CtpA/Prc
MGTKNRSWIKAVLSGACAVVLIAGALLAQTPPPAPATPTPAPAPAPRVRRVRPVIVETDEDSSRHGSSYLGVDIRDLEQEGVARLHVPDDSGVEITMVDQDSPAGKAGMKEQDVIRTFNGEKVESAEQLRRFIRETPPGRTVDLGLMRNGRAMSVKATLADRGKVMGLGPHVMPPMPPMPPMNIEIPAMEIVMRGSRSGMQLEGLTPQLREFFGVPAGQGLLVRSVERGSAAESAGIKAGDVIVRVQNQPVRDVGDFRMATREHSGSSVNVTVVREKREQSLNLKLSEAREGGSNQWHMEFPVDPDQIAAMVEEMRPDVERIQRAATLEVQRALTIKQKELQKSMKEMQKELERELKHAADEMEKEHKD